MSRNMLCIMRKKMTMCIMSRKECVYWPGSMMYIEQKNDVSQTSLRQKKVLYMSVTGREILASNRQTWVRPLGNWIWLTGHIETPTTCSHIIQRDGHWVVESCSMGLATIGTKSPNIAESSIKRSRVDSSGARGEAGRRATERAVVHHIWVLHVYF